MARAVILGGTGVIGRAVATRLLAAGWQVDVTGRDAAHVPDDLAAASGFTFVQSERTDARAMRAAIGEGAELIVDCLCFTEADARAVAPFLADADAAVTLSTKAVYVDEFGNHGNSLVKPVFPLPIREVDATVAPGRGDPATRDGYAANRVAAENALLDSGLPVTVLRAGRVHGAGAARPREWAFLKRALDGREQLALAHRGRGGDHTTAAANVASLVEAVVQHPAARILNVGDADAPTGLAIAETVAAHAGLGSDFEIIAIDDDVDPQYGAHPWDVVPPVVLDLTAARELGWQGETFAQTVGAELDWLQREHELGLTARFDDDPYFAPFLDYRLEDAYLLLRRLERSAI
ncbi:NAD-dependent epimerase/dehydratase family protein [Gryllotalpicola protaetiae]|uniref:NAD-dependent epimerase/dehydratase family protein n=1 Tax=Gryllotalpicola protaetiae TaxID=2419771 RepID=A0A387BHS1_9MICO|nr:NAD-dependent epimerase/dehydratase family protein [Gryllotalpicola protaetiae]AYG02208.1 NAD-dependent epimerase/dehydratase family protein [Gryllotalpicola protaetiae]